MCIGSMTPGIMPAGRDCAGQNLRQRELRACLSTMCRTAAAAAKGRAGGTGALLHAAAHYSPSANTTASA